MAASNSLFITTRHIDRLPRPLVKILTAIVLLLHGILIALALRSIPLVELGGNGGGGGSGNSTIYVSVLNGQSAQAVSRTQQSPVAVAKTILAKEKPQPGLIATRSPAKQVVQTVRTADYKTAKQPESAPLQRALVSNAGAASTKEGGNNAVTGAGKGVGEGNSPGAGHGENVGNSFGPGGPGNGPARSVSLSQLRYRNAVKPEYPARSIQRHESGEVSVQVVVDTAGRVHDARVTSTSGFDRLDEAALKAARRSTFYPYTEHGRARYAKAVIPYRFNLNKR